MARPRALDDAKKREIVALVTAGMCMQKVARYVGCNKKTIRREQQADDDFDQRMRRAEMAANLNPLETMRKASQTYWRAAAWMLERDDHRQARRRESPDRVVISRSDLVKLSVRLREVIRGALILPEEQYLACNEIDKLLAEMAPVMLAGANTPPTKPGSEFANPAA